MVKRGGRGGGRAVEGGSGAGEGRSEVERREEVE